MYNESDSCVFSKVVICLEECINLLEEVWTQSMATVLFLANYLYGERSKNGERFDVKRICFLKISISLQEANKKIVVGQAVLLEIFKE
jgi:hypothetical protein